MRNKYDPLANTLTLLYALIPIVIFFIGWLRPIYSIPATIVLIYSALVHIKLNEKRTGFTELKVDWKKTVLIALVAFIWVYCSGIGGYTNQEWDHHARNAIFYDLLTFDWPIYYDFPPDYHFKALAGKHLSLNYYFTFWLPAACFGKLFGEQMANAFLLFWAYLGLLLSFYYLNRLFNFKYSLVCTGLFIFWSSYDLVGYLFFTRIIHTINFLSETNYFKFYTSFTSNLYNPFNQTVPAWLLTLYILNDSKKLQIFPAVMLLAYSPFAFMGLATAHGLYYLLAAYRTDKKILTYWRELIQALWRLDTVGALIILMIYGLFYQAHSTAIQNVSFWSLYRTTNFLLNIFLIIDYLMAFFLEIGIYLVFIYFMAKRTYCSYKIWFWLIMVVLLLLPLWIIGANSDLATRGSIPFLTVLLVMTLTALIEVYENPIRRHQFYIILCVLFLSFQWPANSMIRSLSFTDKPIRQNAVGSLADPKLDELNDPANMSSSMNNFYSHEPQHYLFYQYVAKR